MGRSQIPRGRAGAPPGWKDARIAPRRRRGIASAARATALAGALTLTAFGLGAGAASAAAAPGGSEPACARGEVRVATGCATRAEASRRVAAIVREAGEDLGLRATITRVDTGRRPLASFGSGVSMAGIPADPRMRFRLGSIAIPYLVIALLRLQDQGRLSLDDTLAEYLPDVPNADRVTLRMLATSTSGYYDWIQGNEAFVESLFENPFRQWTPEELVDVALARGVACDPGTCFVYAHTNFALLSWVMQKVTGVPATRLFRRAVLRPLGLKGVAISRLPALAPPVLHSYSSERGFYEDATAWSPAWTLGSGTVMSGTIADVVRTARAIGTGALLSRRAARERIAPTSAEMPGFSRDLYFGMGLVYAGGWLLQNPVLNGYTGAMAYLPSRRLSIGIFTTQRAPVAASGDNYAVDVLKRLGSYLAPGQPIPVPG